MAGFLLGGAWKTSRAGSFPWTQGREPAHQSNPPIETAAAAAVIVATETRLRERVSYLSLVSLYNTCLRALGSNFMISILSGMVFLFLLVV
jgi:hypothetical protein